MPTTIFLTGASGFLGWTFCQLFAKKHYIVGTYFRNLPKDVDVVDWQRINLIETQQLEKLIKKTKPDIVLHLAFIANAAFCEEHPALSHHINVYTTVALAKMTQKFGIPLIFCSSDLVFNGGSPPYSEGDFCYPLSQYGLQKQIAEEALLSDFEHTIVARLPLLFGTTPPYCSNFFMKTIQALQNKEKVNAFVDEKRTAMSGRQAVAWLERLISYILTQKHQECLLHLASDTSISRYDLCVQMAHSYDLDADLIIPTYQKDLYLQPPRPQNVSMLNTLAKCVLDFEPTSIASQLEQEKDFLFLS